MIRVTDCILKHIKDKYGNDKATMQKRKWTQSNSKIQQMCQKKIIMGIYGLNLNFKEIKYTVYCRIMDGFFSKVSIVKVTSALQVNAVIGKAMSL